jgi:replicative DNA helicase
MTEDILRGVREGTLTPQEAVDAFEIPAVHVKDVSTDNLVVDTLNCGFMSLDENMVFKRQRGELIIFGARPSMGKSAFLFQVAKHIAAKDNVLIYSLEMDRESIKARLMAMESGLSLSQIFKGKVKQPERIEAAKDRLNKLNYYIDDRSGLDVKTIVSSALSHHARHPLSLVLVDYLQLIKTRDRSSRNEEIGDVTAELKGLAKALKCPVLVASQLNRECERRGKMYGDYKPIMADLRDSGNIEQDADIVLFLSRQQVYDGSREAEADITIAKNRNGETGWFLFEWRGAACKFVDTGRLGYPSNKGVANKSEGDMFNRREIF